LLISAENTVIPAQVIVYSPKGANNTIALLFGTSLYDLKESQPPSSGDLIVKDGLRLFAIEPALTKVPEAFFAAKPVEAQVALASLREPSGLLRRLLDGGNSVVAGRLVGAFRRVGRTDIAEEIRAAMTGAGYFRPRVRSLCSRPGIRQADSRRRTHRWTDTKACGSRCAARS